MWKPISLQELKAELINGEAKCEPELLRLWSLIRITPAKWQQHPWGDEGNGFWVVGLLGCRVIWYNDIEDGFNTSIWSKYGEIDEYWCNQSGLQSALYDLYHELLGNEGACGFGEPI